MVIGPGAVITGSAAGVTVIVLDPLIVLPHASVYVQLSVSVPPQPVTVPLRVAVTVPDIRHEPLAELLYVTVGIAGIASQATVTSAGAPVNTGAGAGLTVIVLVTGTRALPHASVAVHVSVIVPPHGPGVAENVDVADVPVIKHEPLSPLV